MPGVPFGVGEELVIGLLGLALTVALAVPTVRLLPRGQYLGAGWRPTRYSRDRRRARIEKSVHVAILVGFLLLAAALLLDSALRIGGSRVGEASCTYRSSTYSHGFRTSSYLTLHTSCGDLRLDAQETTLRPGLTYLMTWTVSPGFLDTGRYLVRATGGFAFRTAPTPPAGWATGTGAR